MATQTAIALTEINGPLTKIEIPIPEPKDTELLIKLTATAIAPFDQKLRDLGLFGIGSRLPAVLTFDLAGIVEKHSPDLPASLAKKFPLGTHVMAQANINSPLGGGLQQHTTIDAVFTSRVPSTISDLAAALYPINGITSFAALFSSEGSNRGLGIPFTGTEGSSTFDYKNTQLAILGGGTRCGKLAVQFAKMVGIGTIITTASPSSFSELKQLGATHVVDRHSPNLVEEVRKVTGDELLYVYDTMSAGDLSLGASLLSNSKKGKLSHLLHGKVSPQVLEKKKEGLESWQMYGASVAHPQISKVFWEGVAGWIEKGLVGGGYKVIEGGLEDVKAINGALDGFRDGGFERWHVKISE